MKLDVVINGNVYVPKETFQQSWIDPKTGLEWRLDKKRSMAEDKINHDPSCGWRVPSLVEFETLLDRSTYGPAMRIEVPFRDSAWYWTSTIVTGHDDYYWNVGCHDGTVSPCHKTYANYIRCVRGEQKQ